MCHLRKKQYQISDRQDLSVEVARNFIFGKIYNHKWMLERMTRDYPLRINVPLFKQTTQHLSDILADVRIESDLDRLRGLEGQAASAYYRIFNEMLLQQKESFSFYSRSRRPPLDPISAISGFREALGVCVVPGV